MSSSVSHTIKQRKKPNDVFITPRALAKLQIDMTADADREKGEKWAEWGLWLDPCRNNAEGSYYSQFPENKDWCEILEGKSFFDYEGAPNVICGNPPYSMLDEWFKKTIELNPDVCSFLIGVSNLTAKRIEWFEKADYGITKLKMLKVYKWYGMSYIVVFEKNKKSIMSVDRTVWRSE